MGGRLGSGLGLAIAWVREWVVAVVNGFASPPLTDVSWGFPQTVSMAVLLPK